MRRACSSVSGQRPGTTRSCSTSLYGLESVCGFSAGLRLGLLMIHLAALPVREPAAVRLLERL